MAIKVIVELQAKPGMRAELKSLLESMVANQGPSQPGFLGSTRYEVLDNPDALVEIADWESAEARVAHMEERGHRSLCASDRDVGRAFQGHGDQGAALITERPGQKCRFSGGSANIRGSGTLLIKMRSP